MTNVLNKPSKLFVHLGKLHRKVHRSRSQMIWVNASGRKKSLWKLRFTFLLLLIRLIKYHSFTYANRSLKPAWRGPPWTFPSCQCEPDQYKMLYVQTFNFKIFNAILLFTIIMFSYWPFSQSYHVSLLAHASEFLPLVLYSVKDFYENIFVRPWKYHQSCM